MSDFNRVILLGRVGNDLELKTSVNGKPYVKISVATHSYKDGEEKTTHWHRVMVFGPQAEICATYLRKGSQVMVEGVLECRAYTDQEGKKVNMVSVLASRVQFLGSGRSSVTEAPLENMEPSEVFASA